MLNYIKQHGSKIYVSEDEAMYSLYHSVYYGFWLRLKKLGFTLVSSFKTFVRQDNIIYIKLNWFFYRASTRERVTLSCRRNRFSLHIMQANKEKLFVQRVCYSRLELPFLQYFKQGDNLLFIRRLGVRTEAERKFVTKWQRHVNDGGKYADMIRRMGVLPPYLPKALTKPIKR